MPTLEFTGERVTPVGTPQIIFREHEQRYNFAAQFVTGKIVLDIACGSGIGSDFLLDAGAKQVFGVDIDKASLEFASEFYPRVKFLYGDASERIPLGDASVDVVVSFETIEHLNDQTRFLAECRRVLKPGGIFICSSPNRDVYKWNIPTGFHVRELTIREFSDLIRQHFVGAQLFSQSEIDYPRWIAKALGLRLTVGLGIKDILKRLAHFPAREVSHSYHYATAPHEISPYRKRFLKPPMYVIALSKRSS